MAIKKNSAAAAAEPSKSKEATKASKTTKAAPKAAPKAAEKAAPAPAPKVEAQALPRIGRKELAAVLRSKVIKSGLAVSPKVAEICSVAYEEAVTEALAAGQEVVLPGFGKFVPIDRPEAEKRNPATGEMVLVAAHRQVKFRVGGKLKQAVNGGPESEEESDQD